MAKGTIDALEAFLGSKSSSTYALHELLMTMTVSLLIALLAGLLDTHSHHLLPGGQRGGRATPTRATTEKH